MHLFGYLMTQQVFFLSLSLQNVSFHFKKYTLNSVNQRFVRKISEILYMQIGRSPYNGKVCFSSNNYLNEYIFGIFTELQFTSLLHQQIIFDCTMKDFFSCQKHYNLLINSIIINIRLNGLSLNNQPTRKIYFLVS